MQKATYECSLYFMKNQLAAIFVGLTMQNLEKLEVVLETAEDSVVSSFTFIVQFYL